MSENNPADSIINEFATYEEYLDSQITPIDLFYLEDKELARQLVELGYRGSGEPLKRSEFDLRKKAAEDFRLAKRWQTNSLSSQGKDLSRSALLKALAEREEANRTGKMTTVVFVRMLNSRNQEISGYIDYAHRLKSESFERYFSMSKVLHPRPSDLSYYNWDTQLCTSNNTPNWQVIAENEGLVFKNKRDRKVVNVDPKANPPGDNTERVHLVSMEYIQVFLVVNSILEAVGPARDSPQFYRAIILHTMDNLFGANYGFVNELMGGQQRGVFKEYFRCFTVAFAPGKERETINYSSGIMLPSSALAKLTTLNTPTPYKFSLTNEQTGKSTHANVLEFIAEEGRAYVPRWMLATLGVQEGELIQLQSVSLLSGKFVKIQPQSTAFLEISDPKAVLEHAFRSYLCMTLGDKIAFMYNDLEYEIEIQELKPSNAVSLLDTDLEVEFAAPVGYVEPARNATSSSSHASIRDEVLQHVQVEKSGWDAMQSGQRLNGKSLDQVSENHRFMVPSEQITPQLGAGDSVLPLRLPLGQLFFGFDVPKFKKDGEDGAEEGNVFKGTGNVLKVKKGKGRK